MKRKILQQNFSGNVLAEEVAVPEIAAGSRVLAAWIILLAGIVVGLLIAIFWLPVIADDTIGVNVANTILGRSATSVTLTASWLSLVFAIAVGLANTFTACNCVVFSCIAPLSSQTGKARMSVGGVLGWMAAGVVTATAVYGIIATILDGQIPGLSKATLPIGQHFPVRLLQSTIVFVILGIVLFYWGLVVLQFARNPLRKWIEMRPWSTPLFLGIIVGCFSIGRPYPLFQKLFQFAADTGNPLLAAGLIALQGLCNIAVMALIFVLLTVGTGGRFERWMQADQFRARAITAFSVIGGGVFFIAYWGVRLPAHFGIGWFPTF